MKTPDDGLKMTKEQIVKALRGCNVPEAACDSCPFHDAKCYCRNQLIRAAADYIEESTPGVIGDIMGHYKKPLVTISFQEMEDGEE